MKTIDMNDFYVDPLLYGNPPQTEVSDEVAEALFCFFQSFFGCCFSSVNGSLHLS